MDQGGIRLVKFGGAAVAVGLLSAWVAPSPTMVTRGSPLHGIAPVASRQYDPVTDPNASGAGQPSNWPTPYQTMRVPDGQAAYVEPVTASVPESARLDPEPEGSVTPPETSAPSPAPTVQLAADTPRPEMLSEDQGGGGQWAPSPAQAEDPAPAGADPQR